MKGMGKYWKTLVMHVRPADDGVRWMVRILRSGEIMAYRKTPEEAIEVATAMIGDVRPAQIVVYIKVYGKHDEVERVINF